MYEQNLATIQDNYKQVSLKWGYMINIPTNEHTNEYDYKYNFVINPSVLKPETLIFNDDEQVLLIEKADSICFPLAWVLKPMVTCKTCRKKKNCHSVNCIINSVDTLSDTEPDNIFCTSSSHLKLNSSLQKFVDQIPAICATNRTSMQIKVLFIGYNKPTRTRYAVVFADTVDFPDTVDFEGYFALTCKLEPDDKYNWLNWVTVGHLRFPITDSYIRDIYSRLYGNYYPPLRTLRDNRCDAVFNLPEYIDFMCMNTDDLFDPFGMKAPDMSLHKPFSSSFDNLDKDDSFADYFNDTDLTSTSTTSTTAPITPNMTEDGKICSFEGIEDFVPDYTVSPTPIVADEEPPEDYEGKADDNPYDNPDTPEHKPTKSKKKNK